MNTNDLKIFEAVATHGSFTKAAEVTFTVQSNVTARIKNLEEEFGAELFNRTPRKVALTVAGETLMQYAKQIAYLVEEAKRNIHQADQVTGQLKIGCIETTMALKAPAIINQFSDNYSGVELEFKSDMRNGLINDVLNYKLDAAFISAPVHTPELDQVAIKTEKLVIIASKSIKTLTDILNQQPLKIVVFDQGCIFRQRLESWITANGIVNYKPIVLNSIEGIINFVEEGLGISILPEEVIYKYYNTRKLSTFFLNKELGTMNTILIFRKNIPLSRQLQAFIECYTAIDA